MWKPINPIYVRDIDPYSGSQSSGCTALDGISARPHRSCCLSKREAYDGRRTPRADADGSP